MTKKAAEPTVKIRVGMEVGYIANSANELVVDTGIPRSMWKAMSADMRTSVFREHIDIHVDNNLDTWADVVE